ncbi:hypothetical protein [Kitasatospora sp. NPDC093679]|uniref:hypothetical protein n=1 Tax=Kitasatospora sp. NPDC093679 TaxID=3154983 RepID=UPI00344420F8
MSSAARPRIGRSYTRARRHPWVLGKLGDWRIPMGPYTPPQLAVASIGAFALIKTFTWWAPVLGPLPVVAWGFAIWAARHSRIGGRSPFLVVLDALSLATAPRAGRMAGRAVRPMRPVVMSGSFFIEDTAGPGFAEDAVGSGPAAAEQTPAPVPAAASATFSPPASPEPAYPQRGVRRSDASLGERVVSGTRPARPRRTAAGPGGASAPALTPLQQMLAAAAAANQTEMGDQ